MNSINPFFERNSTFLKMGIENWETCFVKGRDRTALETVFDSLQCMKKILKRTCEKVPVPPYCPVGIVELGTNDFRILPSRQLLVQS